MKDELSLKDLKLNINELLELGFKKENDFYIFEKLIINNKFKLIIKIDKNNKIISDCYEVATNEILMPYYVTTREGVFLGKIREEYNNIIEKIKENCCENNIFKSEYASLIIKYIKNKYNDELEFLWDKFSNNAIWRNKKNNKWYGLLLTIEKSKIGINEEGTIEIIDLRLETDRLEKLVDNKKYFKGYHMNKKHWITIKLDASVDIKEIYGFIDNSYKLSLNK